jgi:hypothetical protein
MMRSTIYFILFISIIQSSCSLPLRFDNNGQPGRIKFNIELTDTSQMVFVDSIAAFLVPRFQAFSDERKDFVLVKSNDNSDYSLYISILSCQIVPYEKQIALAQKRDKIENKYRDSIQEHLPSEEVPKLIAANIAANVISNAILNPLGFFSVTLITAKGPYIAQPNYKERKIIDSTFSTAHLLIEAKLKQNDDKIIWHDKSYQKYKLTYVISEKEQVQVLTRNTILSLEDKLPFFRILKETK